VASKLAAGEGEYGGFGHHERDVLADQTKLEVAHGTRDETRRCFEQALAIYESIGRAAEAEAMRSQLAGLA